MGALFFKVLKQHFPFGFISVLCFLKKRYYREKHGTVAQDHSLHDHYQTGLSELLFSQDLPITRRSTKKARHALDLVLRRQISRG